MGDLQGFQSLVDLLRQSLRLPGLRGAQQDHELFAAIAGHQIGAPPLRLLQQGRDPLQALIPLAMAEVVVVGLELIHVYHQHRQYPLMATGPLPLPLHGDVPLTAVGDPSQGILQRQ